MVCGEKERVVFRRSLLRKLRMNLYEKAPLQRVPRFWYLT